MKKIMPMIFLAAFIATMPGVTLRSFAQEASTPDEKAIEDIIRLSRLSEQAELMPKSVLSGFQRSARIRDPQVLADVESITMQCFSPTATLTAVKNEISGKYNGNYVRESLAFLQSPLYQKIGQLEVESSKPEAEQQFMDFAQNFLQNNATTQKRIELAKEFNRVSHSSEETVKTMLSMSKYIMIATNNAMPADKRITQAEIDETIDQQKEQMANAYREQTILRMIFTYQTLTDEEFQQYIDFYKSQAGTWLSDAINQGLSKAMDKSGAMYSEKIIGYFAKKIEETTGAKQ